MKNIKVMDVLNLIHNFANPALAYKWDNVGLQLGSADQTVNKVLLTLDVTENAIDMAIENNFDLIVSHHPFIFKAVKKICDPRYLRLIRNNISVIASHTNLDVVKGGVNTVLANRLGLKNHEFISTSLDSELYRFVVFVPDGNADKVAEAAFKAGAGIMDNYTDCMNYCYVQGQFIPQENSNPVVGRKGEKETITELQMEFQVESFKLNKLLREVKKAHIYETPAYYVYPLKQDSPNYGLGLIGDLDEPVTLKDYAKFVKTELNAPNVKLWPGNKSSDSLIKKIAVCGGSGSSLLSSITGRADVLVSADFTYHTILDSKVPIIDAGHFHTEYPVLDMLADLLKPLEVKTDIMKMDNHEITKLEYI